MKPSCLCLGLLITSSLSIAAAQDAAVVPSSFLIKNIRSMGDACRPGTVAVDISSDNEAFTVSFSDFIAEEGPDAVHDNRRVCRLVFDTEQDANWEYAILGLTMRGFAQLDAGLTARQEIRFGTLGSEGEGVIRFKGPIAEDYLHAEQLPLQKIKWSGCRPKANDAVRDFAVNASAVIRGGGRNTRGSGLLTVDSIDGQLEQVYEVLWHRCGDQQPKYVANCFVQGNKQNTLTVKGMGRTAEAAQKKALGRLNQRCEKVKGLLGRCDQSVAQCSTTLY